ncbi:MAG: aminotransferase class V-fold PLP-dependent enzyme [Planctomycetaceae bacterium]|jgi:cysteine desulfurase|nr:aminotransferase class V-fold PLP-dependent enzyme [Planctomycetaceae bacterium]
MIYLDNNATTAVAPEVREAMQPYFEDLYYNPSSAYLIATEIARKIEKARGVIARHFGAAIPGEILFTSCATESNNHVFAGITKANPNRRHIITTAVEHPAVLEVCKDLERSGYEITYLSVDRSGQLNLREYVQALRSDTLLVSVMHANNESGVIFPIERLARIVKETDPNILFHTDATQSATKLSINLSGEMRNVDLLSFSGHKFHTPKGVGGLYIRRGTPCRTFLIGGHQESERRGGTENVPYLIGMARAVELAEKTHDADMANMRRLRDKLQNGILRKIPYVEVNGGGAERMPNTLNIACHYVEGEGILFRLSDAEICASSGSACTSGSLEPSHVLTAMQIPFTAVHGSVRFSLSRYTTDAEIDKTLEVFPEIIAKLRRLSPYWDQTTNAPRTDVVIQKGTIGTHGT